MNNRPSPAKRFNRYSTLKRRETCSAYDELTPVQTILDNAIFYLVASQSDDRVDAKEGIRECWRDIQEHIGKNALCVDQPDSEGNSTLYYVAKLRQHRWNAFDNHTMNLVSQMCDFVENRYLNNIAIQLYFYLNNIDGIPMNNDVAGYILQFVNQLLEKIYDGNFNQFIIFLKNYCDPDNTDFPTRNHVDSVQKILTFTNSHRKNTACRSDLGIGKILFDLSKIEINESDGLACIIRNTKKMTGYTDIHFQDDTADSLSFLFDEKNFHGHEEWMRLTESWLHLIFETITSSEKRNHYIEILLNAGLITSSDIIDYAVKKNHPWGNDQLFLANTLFTNHFNALDKHEIADVMAYLIKAQNFFLIHHLLSTLEDKSKLEIHENNLLQVLMESGNNDMLSKFSLKDLLKSAKLLIEAEPRCILQLQDNDIKHYFNDTCTSLYKNEFDELDLLITQLLLKLRSEKPYLLASMSLFSKQEICRAPHQNSKDWGNINSNAMREEFQPAGPGYGF